jgi:hypothetical protein
LPITQLQQFPGFSQPQAPRLHSSHDLGPTQLFAAQLASPQSESLLAGGTLIGAISNVVSRGHFECGSTLDRLASFGALGGLPTFAYLFLQRWGAEDSCSAGLVLIFAGSR